MTQDRLRLEDGSLGILGLENGYKINFDAGELLLAGTPITGGLDADTEVADPAEVTLTLAVNSDSITSADDGGPRPKLILKRTGADGDSDPTPGFAPIGDIEWETVHTDGTHYTVARLWVDEESADDVVNVGRVRFGVHNGDATEYDEEVYLYMTGYGDVDLTGGNVAVTGHSNLTFNADNVNAGLTFFTGGGTGSVGFVSPAYYFAKYTGFFTTTWRLNVANITASRAVTVPDAAGELGIRVAVPASASATGVVGTWAADGDHFYFCSATDTWVRVPLATW
jgi:hypothetical protein